MVSPLWKASADGDLNAVLAILNDVQPVDIEAKGRDRLCQSASSSVLIPLTRSHRRNPAHRGRQERSHRGRQSPSEQGCVFSTS